MAPDKIHHKLRNQREVSKQTMANYGNPFKRYSNTSQTRGSKLAKFSNSLFVSLFFTSKLAVPLLSTQICEFCYFLSPKILEFGGITVLIFIFYHFPEALLSGCF